MRTLNTFTLSKFIPTDKSVSNTGPTCLTNIQIPANLGCGIRNGHAQKETSHSIEDKIKVKNTHIFFKKTLCQNDKR